MNYSEVKELLTAGFTAEEIRQMMAVNPQDENPQDSQDNPQPEITNVPPAGDQDPAPAEPENTNDSELNNRIDSLTDTVNKLLKAVQADNRKRATLDINPVRDDINKTVDDIMASIIRPEHKKGE